MDFYKEAFSYGLKLLSRRDYSEKELFKKLLKRFPNAGEEVKRAVKELSSLGFIDEYRAVLSYFENKEKKGWGKRKIVYYLLQKGFKEDVVKEVELSYPFDYSYIEREVKKKFSNLKAPKERQKLKAFLLRRGFSFCEVENILSRLNL
ncbi:regulatory protein RecX [Thermovibrio sp.]